MTVPTYEEQKAYSRGYAAGKKKQQADADREAIRASERTFWEQAVLSVGVHLLGCPAWRSGAKTLNSLEDRADLAIKFANYLTKARRSNP